MISPFKLLLPSEIERFFSLTYQKSLSVSDPQILRNAIKYTPFTLKFFSRGPKNNFKKFKDFLLLEKEGPLLSIQSINLEIGYGAFAEEEIKKDSFIREYTGEVEQYDFFNVKKNSYCLELPTAFWSPFVFLINSEKRGNESRFFNHSEQGNLSPYFALSKKTSHVFFIAKKDIKKGEELRFNYGPYFWINKKEPINY